MSVRGKPQVETPTTQGLPETYTEVAKILKRLKRQLSIMDYHRILTAEISSSET